jgi:hypothetical protein
MVICQLFRKSNEISYAGSRCNLLFGWTVICLHWFCCWLGFYCMNRVWDWFGCDWFNLVCLLFFFFFLLYSLCSMPFYLLLALLVVRDSCRAAHVSIHEYISSEIEFPNRLSCLFSANYSLVNCKYDIFFKKSFFFPPVL